MPTPSISIWRLSPRTLSSLADLPPAAHEALRASFSAEEQHRAQAFHKEDDRILYTATHAALRIILGRLTKTPPAELEITAEGGAKPSLRSPQTNPPLRFNLAHSAEAALIATTTSCEVGIDIEYRRLLKDLESLAETILSPAERSIWTARPELLRPSIFYRLWTRKEAYLKAIGLGLFREPRLVTVLAPPDERPPARFSPVSPIEPVEDETTPEAQWFLRDLPADPLYAAAICWSATSSQPALRIHDLTFEQLTDPTNHRLPRIPLRQL